MPKNHVKNGRIPRMLPFLLTFLMAMSLLVLAPTPAKADAITGTVPVGNLPQRVAVDEAANKIYVTSGDFYASVLGKVTVINGADDSVITMLDVEGTPKGVTVDEARHKVYVANLASNELQVISSTNDTVLAPIPVPFRPIAVAYDPAADRIYVAHSTYPGSVTIISGSTGATVTTVSVADAPSAIAVNSSTNTIYVTHEDAAGTVTVIDGNTYDTQTLTAGSYPEGVAVDGGNNKIYVANSGSSTVSVIDGGTNAVVKTIPVGSYPWDVAVNADTHRIYTANQAGQSVSVIDGFTDTVLQTIGIAGNGGAVAVAVDSTRNKIYVPSLNRNDLTVIDGNSIEAAGVTGLTAPAAGATPQTAAALAPGDARYAVTNLTWENLNGSAATLSGGKFANAGCLYQARVELTAQGSYRFPAAGLTPTVDAGRPAAGAVSGGYTAGNTLTFVVTFPQDIAAAGITGLAAPAAGEMPQAYTALTPGDASKYAVTGLAWVDGNGNPVPLDTDGTFLYGGSNIRARIVLTSQPGYKFPAGGMTPTLDGDGTAAPATVSGGDMSGNTLTFVATFSDDIYDYEAYITGLDAPSPGEAPKAAEDLTTYGAGQYCTVSNLTWKNSDGSPATLSGGKFMSGGSSYKAVVELTSQPGYKFPLSGISPSLEGDGMAAPGTVSGGFVSGNKYTFEVNFSDDITTAGVTGLVAPAKGAVPVTDADLTAGNPSQYDIDELIWLNADESPATLTGGKFKAGWTYKAAVILESKGSYKFPKDGLNAAVDAGTPAKGEMHGDYAHDNMLAIMVTFPVTAPDHKAVTGISGVPAAATAGADLTLTGTVAPADATNRTIVWSVKNAGGTGASISGSTFHATAAGTATVTATIVNGLTESSNYTQDFSIAVGAPATPTPMPTATPTATPAPTATPTVTPTATPAPTTAPAQVPSGLLSDIKLSAGRLSKAFAPKTTGYTVNLSEYDSAVTVTPVRAYDGARMTIDGKKVTAKTVALSNGSSATMTIRVIWNGKTRSYKLTIRRPKSANNQLATLAATAGTWSVPFDSAVTSYGLTLPENVGRVTLKAPKASPLASLSSSGGTYTLRNGQAVRVTFRVKSQSGATRTYTVTITRVKSSNALLASLTANVTASVTPKFNTAVDRYTIDLLSGRSAVTIRWKAAQGDAKVYVNGKQRYNWRLSLRHGETKTLPITVRAQDGSTRTYTITVRRK